MSCESCELVATLRSRRATLASPASTAALIALALVLACAPACKGSTVGETAADAGASSIGEPVRCPAPYADCDGNPSTICETRLDDDVAHCGGCGVACPAPGAHQVAICAASACTVACDAAFADCDHDPSNGCEEPLVSCGVTTIVPNLPAPMGLAVDESFVYYGTKGSPPDYLDGVLYKAPKNGGAPVVLATKQNVPLNLTVDDTRVYWTNGGHVTMSDGTVVSIAKSGGAPTVIAGPMMRPGNPVIVGDRIFWTARGDAGGRVLSAHKDGSDAEPTVVASNIGPASDLEVAGTTLVWASSGLAPDQSDALVERANLDGSSRVTLAKGIASPSYQLGVAADALFVGSFVDRAVRRVPFDLSGPVVVATSLGQPHELIVDGDVVFVSTSVAHRVVALPVKGGSPVVVADGQLFPSYMAMDADYIYWTDGPLSGAAAVRKARKPGR